ncbi:MAG: hypothetical protein Q9M39_00595 [Sulfurovum sp.]|nr:hypothetical protein [Sulfurovum sp.]
MKKAIISLLRLVAFFFAYLLSWVVAWESDKGGENDFFQSVHHTYYNYLFISEAILSIKAGVNRPADGYLFYF